MWTTAGVHRTRETLEAAASTLAGWRASGDPLATRAEREDGNLLDLARLVVSSALVREESRGAHFRSDFPYSTDGVAHHSVRASVAHTEVTVPC
ncbi:hypothetical protein [Leifsonia poae]|uniref:hypothetical protein n=1 Tax=Leifsonia poae TaxID=110933 RepID=UPI003D66DBCC